MNRIKKKWLIISVIFNIIFSIMIGVHMYRFIANKISKASEVETEKMNIVNYPYYIDKTALFKGISKNEKAIVFMGDSLTDYCEWSEFLQNPAIKNRGIAGDTTYGVLNRLDEIIELKPDKIFLLIGTNDLINGRIVADIAIDYEKIVNLCTQRLPGTKVYVQSIPPVNFKLSSNIESNEKIITLNQEIKKIAKQHNVQYLDLYSVMVTKNGELNSDYTTDGLHFNSKGYERWRGLLTEYLD